MLSCLIDSKNVHYSHQCSNVRCRFKNVVRYLFLAALRENNVSSWVKLGNYLQKLSFLTEDLNADAEITYYGKRSIAQLLDILDQSSESISHMSKTRLLPIVEVLKSTFNFIEPNHEQPQCVTDDQTHPFTEIALMRTSQHNLTTLWECVFNKFYRPIDSLDKEIVSLLCWGSSGNSFSCQNANILLKLRHAADFTKSMRPVNDLVDFQNPANGQDVRKTMNSQNFNFDDDDFKSLRIFYPKNGFEAVTYFAICCKFGFHGYMFFQRGQSRSLNDSPYDLEPKEILEVSIVLVYLENTFSFLTTYM
ncbi:hypothetical protein P879_11775 [Paragonimus westermani]|uniref:Uncharacterized protein n=1 Tax=Paragonimus westermani TaxID=34504 RepID=A0A8T0DB37_9TREM|nr:hypothetical protein P879_11775 [Paragonimus westermani]